MYVCIYVCMYVCMFASSFLVQDLQDLMQDLASLARKILARLAYFLQDDFYWVAMYVCTIVHA